MKIKVWKQDLNIILYQNEKKKKTDNQEHDALVLLQSHMWSHRSNPINFCLLRVTQHKLKPKAPKTKKTYNFNYERIFLHQF